jgi:phage head maturation protease
MTAPPLDLKRYRSATTLTMRATPNELPAGVCGQVEGVALVYGVVDTYGTTFAPGCLARTIRERVAAGKVKLYFDHGDVAQTGTYDTHLHIGVVREVWDATNADGKSCAMFRADIFDTEPGREAHEYLRAIAATGSETGVSIGMMEMPKTTRAMIDGVPCEQISEVPLREISVTGESAVPGTRVTTVRAEVLAADTSVDYFALLDGIVAHLGHAAVRAHLRPVLTSDGDTDSDAARADSDAVTPEPQDVARAGTEPVTPNADMAERLAFVRSIYPTLT